MTWGSGARLGAVETLNALGAGPAVGEVGPRQPLTLDFGQTRGVIETVVPVINEMSS